MKKDVNTDRMIYQIDETRNRILEVAEKMFIKKGLFETKMKDLAEVIGISRTSLYRYYRDKLDLSLSIVVSLLQEINNNEIHPQIDSLPDGISRVEYLLKKRWLSPEHSESYRFLAEFDAYYSGSRIPDGFREKMEKALSAIWDNSLEDYIKEGQNDGSICPDLDIKLISEILPNAIRSLHQRLILRGDILVEISRVDLEAIMDEYLKILLKGIQNK